MENSSTNVPIPTKGDSIWKYRVDRGEESMDDRLIANPYEEAHQVDLTPEELAAMMKQYEDQATRVMGGKRQMPNPGYSKDPEVNRKNIKKYKPKE